MAKYQTFDEYINGEKIVRYLDCFKRCWYFATEASEAKFTSTNTGSLQLLLIAFIEQCPSLDGSEKILLSDFVTWAQQQQAGA